MTRLIIRRVLWTVPVILLVILMTFLLMRQIEGNPFRHSERAIPESIQRNLEAKYGLDDPWYVQYVRYVRDVATFDLGPDVLRAVQRGRLMFAVDQQAYLQGYLPVALLTQRARYGLFPDEGGVIATGPHFVTKANAQQAIELSRRSIR